MTSQQEGWLRNEPQHPYEFDKSFVELAHDQVEWFHFLLVHRLWMLEECVP
jgi:hypothetical protein